MFRAALVQTIFDTHLASFVTGSRAFGEVAPVYYNRITVTLLFYSSDIILVDLY